MADKVDFFVLPSRTVFHLFTSIRSGISWRLSFQEDWDATGFQMRRRISCESRYLTVPLGTLNNHALPPAGLVWCVPWVCFEGIKESRLE